MININDFNSAFIHIFTRTYQLIYSLLSINIIKTKEK